MNYKFKVTQTIHKFIEIEGQNENEAYEKMEGLLNEGKIHFDDEPWLDIEVNYSRIES